MLHPAAAWWFRTLSTQHHSINGMECSAFNEQGTFAVKAVVCLELGNPHPFLRQVLPYTVILDDDVDEGDISIRAGSSVILRGTLHPSNKSTAVKTYGQYLQKHSYSFTRQHTACCRRNKHLVPASAREHHVTAWNSNQVLSYSISGGRVDGARQRT
ncbi:hypothetical protein EDD16DRAFT_56941 [Pisolithus croceorrhizus]|nr:hypothetical protein EDD16DRAFT_56941 [Pisolithus croceorrhizus]